jgi:hypothetical protein
MIFSEPGWYGDLLYYNEAIVEKTILGKPKSSSVFLTSEGVELCKARFKDAIS